MKRVLGPLAAVVLLLSTAAAPAAHASSPPSAPTNVTATVVADGQRAASVDIAWTPSSDLDGTVASYELQLREGDAITVSSTTATTAQVVVPRGRSYAVSVVAVDDAGDRSPSSASTSFAPAAIPVDLAAGARPRGGTARSCAGVTRACTFESLGGATYSFRARSTTPIAGTRVELTASWRRPGTSRFVASRGASVTLGAAGASYPLARIVRESGTWCVRVRLASGDLVARGLEPRPVCVRYRPPIELGWAGDTVIGSGYGLPPNGGRDQLRAMHRTLRGPDLMVGNYEGTLSRGGSSRCSGGPLCYIFQAPPERARNLAVAGFDVMNLANNHGLDKGADARRQTVRALERVGIAAAGLPGRVTTVQVEDTRVSIVGISPYPGTTSMRSPEAIRSLVRAARRSGDVVVVAFHAGLEGPAGAHVPRGADYGTQTRAALHTAVDAGADLVLGSGPHVVRGVERYRSSYIVYSAGNFAGWHNFGLGGLTSQSGAVRFDLDYRGNADGGTWDGVVLGAPGVPHLDRSGRVVRRVASLSRADFGSRGARFSRGGRFR